MRKSDKCSDNVLVFSEGHLMEHWHSRIDNTGRFGSRAFISCSLAQTEIKPEVHLFCYVYTSILLFCTSILLFCTSIRLFCIIIMYSAILYIYSAILYYLFCIICSAILYYLSAMSMLHQVTFWNFRYIAMSLYNIILVFPCGYTVYKVFNKQHFHNYFDCVWLVHWCMAGKFVLGIPYHKVLSW